MEEVATGYSSRKLQVLKEEWDEIDGHEDVTSQQLWGHQGFQLFGLLKSSVKKVFGAGSKKAGIGSSGISNEEEADASLDLQENGGEKTVRRPGFFRCGS